MKKWIRIGLALGIGLALCACGKDGSQGPGTVAWSGLEEEVPSAGESSATEETSSAGGLGLPEEASPSAESGAAEEAPSAREPGAAEGTASSAEPGIAEEVSSAGEPGVAERTASAAEPGLPEEASPSAEASEGTGGLSLLYHMQRQRSVCCSGAGYYYLTEERVRLTDGRYARHLMYMDFATGQEIYLCSNAACAHNTADCTAVFPDDEFAYSTALFVWQDSLYFLSKESDHDGSAVMGILGGGGDAAVDAAPTVLYRAGLDGTNRTKFHAFDPAVTVEDLVVADDGGLYLVTKKVTTEWGGGNAYQTSTDRKLVYLDLSSGRESVLFSMDFGDFIDWDILDGAGRELVLYGIDFGRVLSEEEKHSDDNDIYDASEDVFAMLDVDTGKCREIYRVRTPKARSYETDEHNLYYSEDGDGKIISVDLRTGEQRTLCSIVQDSIWGRVGDRIYTRDQKDGTYYFINVNTGEISHCGLHDRSTEYSLKIVASVGDQVLTIYDSDVTKKSDGSYIVNGYRYALIRKEDLFAGRAEFVPIRMLGSGL